MKHQSYLNSSRERQALSRHLRSSDRFAPRSGEAGKSYSFFNAGSRDVKLSGSTEALSYPRQRSHIGSAGDRGQYNKGYLNVSDCRVDSQTIAKPGNTAERRHVESPVQYFKSKEIYNLPSSNNNSNYGARPDGGDSSRRGINRSNILRGSLAQQITQNAAKALNSNKVSEIDTRANRSVNTSQYFTMLWNHRSIKAAELRSKHESKPSMKIEKSPERLVSNGYRPGSRDSLAKSRNGYLLPADKATIGERPEESKHVSVLERAKALVNVKTDFNDNLQRFASKTHETRETRVAGYLEQRGLGFKAQQNRSRDQASRGSQDQLNVSKPVFEETSVLKRIRLSKMLDDIGKDGRPNHLVQREILGSFFEGKLEKELVSELVSKVVQYKLAFEGLNKGNAGKTEINKDNGRNQVQMVKATHKASMDFFQQQKTPNPKTNLMPLFNKTVTKKRKDMLLDNSDGGNMIAERSENSDIFFTGDLVACQKDQRLENKQSLSQNGDITRPRFDIDDDDASLLVELEHAMKK